MLRQANHLLASDMRVFVQDLRAGLHHTSRFSRRFLLFNDMCKQKIKTIRHKGFSLKAKFSDMYCLTLRPKHLTFDSKIMNNFVFPHQSKVSYFLLGLSTELNWTRLCVNDVKTWEALQSSHAAALQTTGRWDLKDFSGVFLTFFFLFQDWINFTCNKQQKSDAEANKTKQEPQHSISWRKENYSHVFLTSCSWTIRL